MTGLAVAWGEGWLWLGGSLLLAGLWANIAWFFREPRSGIAGEAVAGLVAWRFSPWLFQMLRLLYYVGVPFAALLLGHDAIVRRFLGIQWVDLSVSGGGASVAIASSWLDWARDIEWAGAVGLSALGILAVGWGAYHRALSGVDKAIPPSVIDASGWYHLREAAYHEVHWAFYRNVPIVVWGEYWGVWAGLLLVALEAVLNPAWLRGLGDPQRAPVQFLRGALAVVSSALFLWTQNLWLAWVVHWGISWGLATLYQTPRDIEAQAEIGLM